MSSLYKRPKSPYYWWATRYKGRLLRKSTGMKQKQLAIKVQGHWDLSLVKGNLDFLGLSSHSPMNVKDYCRNYFDFLTERKSERNVLTVNGILTKFVKFLDSQNIKRLDEITVKVLDGYINWLECASKTKKNHIVVVSLMLDQAIKEDVLTMNPAKKVTLPKIEKSDRHRLFEPIDLEIIFRGAGSWSLYYLFLHHTGLRAGDVATLTYGNINREKALVKLFIRKSKRTYEIPLTKVLLDSIPKGRNKDEPLFPSLYADVDNGEWRKVNDNLAKPRKYMQALLEAARRPSATLHSFRHTFTTTLRDLGLTDGDRQVLLAHASSETTKIYTHPNFELAAEYMNRIPDYRNNPVCT